MYRLRPLRQGLPGGRDRDDAGKRPGQETERTPRNRPGLLQGLRPLRRRMPG